MSFLPALQRIEENLGKPAQIVADGGYTTRENHHGHGRERGRTFIGSYDGRGKKRPGCTTFPIATRFIYESGGRAVCIFRKARRSGLQSKKPVRKQKRTTFTGGSSWRLPFLSLSKEKCCPGTKEAAASL